MMLVRAVHDARHDSRMHRVHMTQYAFEGTRTAREIERISSIPTSDGRLSRRSSKNAPKMCQAGPSFGIERGLGFREVPRPTGGLERTTRGLTSPTCFCDPETWRNMRPNRHIIVPYNKSLKFEA
eukprot:300326-Amorphochlora_amoeboformis.AAC.1